MFKTLTQARIYEQQGLKVDALKIYIQILKSRPNDAVALEGVARLEGEVDLIRAHFDNASNEQSFYAIEEWLVTWS